jgi:hypothetical protein
MTNPLRPLVGRLLSHTAPKKSRPFSDRCSRVTYYQEITADGLVISYYPPRDLAGPYIVVGRRGRFPTPTEQAHLLDAVRCCTGVETLTYGTAQRQGWHIIEIHWKPKTAETPALAAPVAGAVEATAIYQVIRYSKDGLPYTYGVSTDPGQADAMRLRTPGRSHIQTIYIFPKPVPIQYGLELRNRP